MPREGAIDLGALGCWALGDDGLGRGYGTFFAARPNAVPTCGAERDVLLRRALLYGVVKEAGGVAAVTVGIVRKILTVICSLLLFSTVANTTGVGGLLFARRAGPGVRNARTRRSSALRSSERPRRRRESPPPPERLAVGGIAIVYQNNTVDSWSIPSAVLEEAARREDAAGGAGGGSSSSAGASSRCSRAQRPGPGVRVLRPRARRRAVVAVAAPRRFRNRGGHERGPVGDAPEWFAGGLKCAPEPAPPNLA